MSIRFLCGACALPLLLAATPALADHDPTIIVIAHRAAQDALDRARTVPGGVDVVSNLDYADRSVVSLRDALAYSPGVYLQPRFGQEVRISIRGSGLSRGFHMRGLTLLQDGVPINLADDNGDFQELDPAFLDHLEVHRGANALRFGSGTLGGAINGVTPVGRDAPGLHARIEGGSFDFRRGLVSFGTGGERADAWAAISHDRHDGDRDHARRTSLRFHGNVGLRLAEGIDTRFHASINRIDQELPGALTRATALASPKTGSFVGDQARDIDSLRLQNRTRFTWGNQHLDVGLFLNAKDLYHPIFQVVDQSSTDRGLFFRFEHEAGPLGLTLGAESRWGTTAARRFVNLSGRRGALTFDARQTARTSSAHVEARLRVLPGLSLIAGAIHADGERRQRQTFPAPVTGKASFSATSPRFGVLWQASDAVQVFANFSRSAEFPTFVELAQVAGFVPVSAQRAWTAEIGTRGSAGPLAWDIALYDARLSGEMLQYTVAPDVPAATFNAGRTIHRGIEAGLTLTPLDWLRLRQTWHYSDFRFSRDRQYGNNRLPVIPRHVLRTELRIGTDAIHVSPHVEWVPSAPWADYRNTQRGSAYALLGMTAAAKLNSRVEAFADLRNLTGKRAIGDISAVIAGGPASAIFYPVERRSAVVGLRTRF